MRRLKHKALSYLIKNGVLKTIEYVFFRINEWRWRKRLGITDYKSEKLSDFGEDDQNNKRYGPTHVGKLSKIFKYITIKPGVDVFIDFGSGKGVVTRFAAQFPLKKVLGVELVPEFAEIGRNLLRQQKSRL